MTGADAERFRARVLAALSHGPLTMVELANRLGDPLGDLWRVMNDLLGERLVEYVDEPRVGRVPSETRPRVESAAGDDYAVRMRGPDDEIVETLVSTLDEAAANDPAAIPEHLLTFGLPRTADTVERMLRERGVIDDG